MELAEAPMILFTTIAQMCVGAFVVLGVIQLLARLRHSADEVDRLSDPTLMVIGPAMILGLLVSMLHMHDVWHTLNVIRHWQTSWLSREILFGCAFAGAGFVFFVLQWRRWGPAWLRQAVAAVAAILGVGLLVSMTMIYFSLITVPAWHTWFTPVQFASTAVLLGSLLIAASFVAVERWGLDHESGVVRTRRPFRAAARGRTAELDADAVRRLSQLIGATVRWCVITAGTAAAVICVASVVHTAQLGTGSDVARSSLAAYSPGITTVRFVLLIGGAGMLGLFSYYLSREDHGSRGRLFPVLVVAFVCALLSELLGRVIFYATMMRVGV